MAATVTHLVSTFNTTAGNKTGTGTSVTGNLIVVIASTSGVAGGTTAVSDDDGGTYTQVDINRTGFSTTGVLTAWIRNALVASGKSTVYTATQGSSTGGGLSVLSVTGMSLTGASAVRSSGGQSSGGAGATPAPVLSLTPLSSNPIITAISNANSRVTQRSGYTEDFDNGYSTPSTGLEVSHLASGETSATITFGGTSATAFASIALELAFNTAPTVALNSPADAATGVSTTPDLTYTGTDADSDDIRYQVCATSAFDFNSKKDFLNSQPLNATVTGVGQSFHGVTSTLQAATFYLKKTGAPTGNAVAKLYTHSGSYGSSSLPTGAALATSDNFDVAGLLTTQQLITFTFSGANQYAMSSGIDYIITVEYTGGADTVDVGIATAGTHSGNRVNDVSGTWSNGGTTDLIFYIFSSSPVILEKISGGSSTTDTLTTSNTAWTAPIGVTSIVVKAWGAGGGGGGSSNVSSNGVYGGGGGAYSQSTLTVVPGTSYTVSVGAGGTAGTGGASPTNGGTGGDTYFNTTGTLLAKGGTGGGKEAGGSKGIGGAAGSGVGTITKSGGDGGTSGAVSGGSGGGGSAGDTTNGSAGSNGGVGAGGAGGTAGTTNGAAGGAGGSSGAGVSGSAPGGAGGGAAAINTNGGAGADGKITITYTPGDTGFTDITNGADTDPFASTDQVKYTVQAGDILTANTTYYWRVAGIDPSGTNTYGAWSSTRSFTTASGSIPNKIYKYIQALNRGSTY